MRKNHTHRISEVMKRALVVLALCCFLVSPKDIGQADAQIFIVDDEEFMNSDRAAVPSIGIIPVPGQGDQLDWVYTPLGDGWLLLLGLGGMYLGGKRLKDKKHPKKDQ